MSETAGLGSSSNSSSSSSYLETTNQPQQQQQSRMLQFQPQQPLAMSPVMQQKQALQVLQRQQSFRGEGNNPSFQAPNSANNNPLSMNQANRRSSKAHMLHAQLSAAQVGSPEPRLSIRNLDQNSRLY